MAEATAGPCAQRVSSWHGAHRDKGPKSGAESHTARRLSSSRAVFPVLFAGAQMQSLQPRLLPPVQKPGRLGAHCVPGTFPAAAAHLGIATRAPACGRLWGEGWGGLCVWGLRGGAQAPRTREDWPFLPHSFTSCPLLLDQSHDFQLRFGSITGFQPFQRGLKSSPKKCTSVGREGRKDEIVQTKKQLRFAVLGPGQAQLSLPLLSAEGRWGAASLPDLPRCLVPMCP